MQLEYCFIFQTRLIVQISNSGLEISVCGMQAADQLGEFLVFKMVSIMKFLLLFYRENRRFPVETFNFLSELSLD